MRDVTFWEAEIRRQQNDDGEFLVARRGDHIEGFAGSTSETDGRWELVWLFVSPEYAGRGVGSELHDVIVANSKRARPSERFLWAVPGNRLAERFYTDRGWQPTTETKDVTTPAGTFPLRKWILPA
jgi:GNAT superfamily N-acetyltransferase